MKRLDTLAAIVSDLTAVLDAEDRYSRLLDALRIAIPYDAASLLRVSGTTRSPLPPEALPRMHWGEFMSAGNIPDLISSGIRPILSFLTRTAPYLADNMPGSWLDTTIVVADAIQKAPLDLLNLESMDPMETVEAGKPLRNSEPL